MHFEKLHLSDVRQFSDASYEFQPGFNLIVGENGSGKTTILRSLLAVVGSRKYTGGGDFGFHTPDIRLGSDRLSVESGFIDEQGMRRRLCYTRKENGDISRDGKRADLPLLFFKSNQALHPNLREQTPRQLKPWNSNALENDRDATSPPLSGSEFLYQTEKGINPEIRTEERFARSKEIKDFVSNILSKLSAQFQDFEWRFEAYDCEVSQPNKDIRVVVKGDPIPKNMGDITYTICRGLSDLILRSFQLNPGILANKDQQTILVDAEGFIMGGKDREHVTPPFDNFLESILTGRYGGYDYGSSLMQYIQACVAEVKLAPQIVIKVPGGNLSLGQCSDGEMRIFSLFVEILRVLLRSSSKPLPEISAVVLIDEIDIHLHPKWQRQVIPLLEDSFPGCQFIATTHSPFVIQSVDRERVQRATLAGGFRFGEEGKEARSIEDIAEEIQGVEIPQQSIRAKELGRAAKRYFTLLRKKDVDRVELELAEQAYRVASEPFASNPALEALLRVEKAQARGER